MKDASSNIMTCVADSGGESTRGMEGPTEAVLAILRVVLERGSAHQVAVVNEDVLYATVIWRTSS